MKTIKAGAITAGYENGFIRRVSYGETEILRLIYFALRDENWNTFGNHILNEQISADDETFDIRYDCFNERAGVRLLEWRVRLAGNRDGSIVFTLHGTAKKNFLKNRAGFCVLHPLSFAGEECNILHPDGNSSRLPFPVHVAPQNPFQNISGMEWKVAGLRFKLTFSGDVFETEDQRNWGDASYKTFCTPLEKPFPVELREGDYIFQQVTLSPLTKITSPAHRKPFISLRRTGTYSKIPSLGVGASSNNGSLTAAATAALRALNLRHYRVEVHPSNDSWVRDFSKDCEDAYSLNLPLEVALHTGKNFEEAIESFTVLCLQNKVRLRKILLLQDNALVTGQAVIACAARLKAALPGVIVGGGTNFNYNELNKNPLVPAGLDFVSFSIDPQEHAIDDLTILENAEAHEHLVKSAKAAYGPAVAVHASPVTLKRRFNPYATDPTARNLSEQVKTDVRQKTDFAAIWTFASICSLARGGASYATYYQTVGPQGVLTDNGDPYPVYEVLKRFSPFQRMKCEIVESSRPLHAQGVVLDDTILAVVNISAERQEVHVDSECFTLAPGEIRFEKLHGA